MRVRTLDLFPHQIIINHVLVNQCISSILDLYTHDMQNQKHKDNICQIEKENRNKTSRIKRGNS